MKFILSLAIVCLLVPTGFSSASEPDYKAMLTQLKSMQAQLTTIQMKHMARVMGVSTSNLFQVTSNTEIIAQSYVPVTKTLATNWCADMVAIPSFTNTAIECTHEGTTIFKK